MRFLFINTGSVSQNAGIIRCLGLGEQLIAFGHTVFILINDHPDNLKQYGNTHNGISILYSSSGSVKEQFSKFLNIRKLKNIDFIHCMGIGSSVLLPALINKILFRNRAKIIVDFEDRQVFLVSLKAQKTMLFYEWLAIKRADTVICASKELSTFFNKRYNTFTHYLPFAIKSRISVKKKENTSDAITIAYIGNIIAAYKDQILMLFNIVKIADQKVKLLLGGTGNLQKYFKDLSDTMGISHMINFVGFVFDEDLPQFFSKADVLAFYLPDNEINRFRCPNKAFLYASTGLPIVASNFGEIKNVLKQYSGSVFFDNNWPADKFFECILIASKKGLSEDAEFLNNNNWQKRTTQYLQIIEGDNEGIN